MFSAGDPLREVRKRQLPGQEVGQAVAATLQAMTQEIGMLPGGKSAVQDFSPAGARQGIQPLVKVGGSERKGTGLGVISLGGAGKKLFELILQDEYRRYFDSKII